MQFLKRKEILNFIIHTNISSHPLQKHADIKTADLPSWIVKAMGLRVKSGVVFPSGSCSTNCVIMTPGTFDFFLIPDKKNKRYSIHDAGKHSCCILYKQYTGVRRPCLLFIPCCCGYKATCCPSEHTWSVQRSTVYCAHYPSGYGQGCLWSDSPKLGLRLGV